MLTEIQHHLIASLWLWSLLSLGTTTSALYLNPNPFWRAFWFMSGLWGLIDGAIAWFSLVQGPQPSGELMPILQINAGLDVIYVLTALFLLTRKKPALRGFGLAVLVQGAFLLILDGYFWWRCALVSAQITT